ncbi:hypothetical protein ILUMI_06139 [Ignelater luminosus]|uniref:Peptidase S1 domain-containing protein n=1 Tax=Ignelater luminosus TaxID=2038154 RepID=A0A8K0DAK8_IGNLU|nr:hypothetical protein ILUMI_06139 [Ignelater luminosus]
MTSLALMLLEDINKGGTDAEHHQFPYIVSLQYLRKHRYGGFILSFIWVVTAGHCCDEKRSPKLICSKFFVVAGLLHQGERHPDVQDPLFSIISAVNPSEAQQFKIKSLVPVLKRFSVFNKFVTAQKLDDEWRAHAMLDFARHGLELHGDNIDAECY